MAIIDSHLHIFTANMVRQSRERMPAYRQKAVESARWRGKTFEARMTELEGLTLEDHARSWLDASDAGGVEADAFIAMGGANEDLAQFVALNPARLIG